MLILGGKIHKDSYINNPEIPEYYFSVNFNDYGYSFLACFTLMMLNNINITINSLSGQVGSGLKFYFILFYLIAIMLILNISHTFILDMYTKMKEYESRNKGNEEIEGKEGKDGKDGKDYKDNNYNYNSRNSNFISNKSIGIGKNRPSLFANNNISNSVISHHNKSNKSNNLNKSNNDNKQRTLSI